MAKKIDVQEEAKKIWVQTKKRLAKLRHETAKLAKRGEEEVIRASKIGRLRLEIMGIDRKRRDLYQKIGERTVELDAKGKIEVKELKALCGQVHKLDSQTKKKDAEIKKAKKK